MRRASSDAARLRAGWRGAGCCALRLWARCACPAAALRAYLRTQAASLAPAIAVTATTIDPLIEGIVFGAVDPSEITVQFGDQGEDALAEAEDPLTPEEHF